jgi:hypothetical protein
VVFLVLPLPNSPILIWPKFKAVMQNAAPGRAPRGVARHGTVWHGSQRPPLVSLPPRWRNMQSLLLWPISFFIFGMCSPWRKSAATVWTVCPLHTAVNVNEWLGSFMMSHVNRGRVACLNTH